MLKTKNVNPLKIAPVLSKDSTINEIGNNEVNGVKVDITMAKSKS